MKAEERLIAIIKDNVQTESDIAFVEQQAEKYGVQICRTNCSDRYRDAAVQVLSKIRHAQYAKDASRKYVLREGVDVIWRGIRINNTCSDEQLAEYLAGGFPQDFFERMAEPESEQENASEE